MTLFSRIWNYVDKVLLEKCDVGDAVRSCAFDAEGTHISAGLTNGSFIVLKVKYVSDSYNFLFRP